MSLTSDTTPTTVNAPAPVVSVTSSTGANLIVTLLIPLVTIVGLFVGMYLHDLSAATGVGLIGGLAGLHGGAAVATNASAVSK